MPYLRLYLGETPIDEVLLSEVLLQSVISHHILEEEKQKMFDRHSAVINNSSQKAWFVLETLPSRINFFRPLRHENGQ